LWLQRCCDDKVGPGRAAGRVDELERDPDINFLVEFEKGRKSSVNRHFSFYVMSAFLCEEVINRKGFKDVLKLVYSGDNGELFFENLKSVLDIDKSNFHESILRLIDGK